MILLAVDGGATLDVPPMPPPPEPTPAPPAPVPAPVPPPPTLAPAPAPGQGAAPTFGGAQIEPAGEAGGEVNPLGPTHGGTDTGSTSAGAGTGGTTDGTKADAATTDATGDGERTLESAYAGGKPPGVGHTWALLLAEVFVGPPLTHTQLQGTNDSVVGLLKTVPAITVRVPDHPTVL